MADMTAAVESSGSTFGLGIGAGVDYYVFDNIYIGLEMGLGWESYTDGGGSTSITAGGTTTDVTTESSGSNSSLSLGGGNMGFRVVGDSNKQQLNSFIKGCGPLFFVRLNEKISSILY